VLTDTGYFGGFVVYIGATLIALALFNAWFLRGRSWGLRALVSLPIAGLLLTPAYIAPDAETLAPALIVTAFRWLIDGPEAAAHALRPLALFSGLGTLVGVLACALGLLRRRRSRRDPALDLSVQ